jgi:tRNA threonylcarbamoyladenosine biosynthesis protein TsaB
MRALAIETSGSAGSLAIVEPGQILAQETFPHGLKHAAQMLPRLDALLRLRGWKPDHIEEIYVSVGPGSFTGLRIGITLAKTIALAVGAKLVAVPSPRVLAENAPPEALHLLIVLDARRGSVFTARYQRIDHAWTELEPAHLDRLTEALARAPRPVHLLGEGLSVHTPPIDPGIVVTERALWMPAAATVARLGAAMARAGDFTAPDALVPLYLRQSEAEEKWEKQAGF